MSLYFKGLKSQLSYNSSLTIKDTFDCGRWANGAFSIIQMCIAQKKSSNHCIALLLATCSKCLPKANTMLAVLVTGANNTNASLNHTLPSFQELVHHKRWLAS